MDTYHGILLCSDCWLQETRNHHISPTWMDSSAWTIVKFGMSLEQHTVIPLQESSPTIYIVKKTQLPYCFKCTNSLKLQAQLCVVRCSYGVWILWNSDTDVYSYWIMIQVNTNAVNFREKSFKHFLQHGPTLTQKQVLHTFATANSGSLWQVSKSANGMLKWKACPLAGWTSW